jgi:photosystem II stability/assembly factor-like uncharacterized protein
MNRSSMSVLGFAAAAASLGAMWSTPSVDHDAASSSDDARLATVVEQKRVRGDGPTGSPREAQAFFDLQRFGPGGGVMPREHLRAVRDKIRMRELRAKSDRGAGGVGGITTWTELGPHNVGGRTRAMVIDPSDPNVMYAAGVRGGVWKSTDAGANWLVTDDLMANLAVSALAMDPTDPNILYAGTGEGVFGGNSSARGEGIFKTVDGGANWVQLASTTTGAPAQSFWYVNRIAISPNDPGRVYAATRHGVWRSPDAGATWSLILRNPVYVGGATASSSGSGLGCMDLVVRNDRNPDVLWAAFGSFQADGLFRSDDGGDTWVSYGVPINQGRMSLALAPSDNDVLYICMADNGQVGALGEIVNVFRSTNDGETFEGRIDFTTITGPKLLSNPLLDSDCYPDPTYSQGWHDNAIAVDPLDPDIVWVGGIELFRSDDGGRTFGFAAYWFADQIGAIPNTKYSHADNHLIVFHPDYDGAANQSAYACSDGGMYRSDNARALTSMEDCPHVFGADPVMEIEWSFQNNGYGTSQFYHGDAGQDRASFGAGAQDQGVYIVEGDTAADQWHRAMVGDGGYVLIDPSDADTIYANIQFFPSMRKSTDGGFLWNEANNGITDTDGLFITPMAMDSNDTDVLWTGGHRVWRTMDGAANWSLARAFPFPNGGQISAIAVAPSDSNTVYLGFTSGTVAVSTDALSANPTWSEYGIFDGLPGTYISSVAVHPSDPTTAYVTTSYFGGAHVLRTTNSGDTWFGLDGTGATGIPAIPAHWIAIRPSDPSHLFVATELGVFASEDTGATWTPTTSGMPNTIVETLDFPSDDRLVAFTYGRGAFYADLGGCDGDANGDGAVDVNDISYVLFRLGDPCGAPGCDGDTNGDGAVDVNDISYVLFRLGNVCP